MKKLFISIDKVFIDILSFQTKLKTVFAAKLLFPVFFKNLNEYPMLFVLLFILYLIMKLSVCYIYCNYLTSNYKHHFAPTEK